MKHAFILISACLARNSQTPSFAHEFVDGIWSSTSIVQPFGPRFYYCDQKFADALKDLSHEEKLQAYFLNGIKGYQKNLLMKTSHKIASLYMEIDIVSEAHGAGQIDFKEVFFEKKRLRDEIDTLHSEHLDILKTFQELKDGIPVDIEFANEVLAEEKMVLECLEKSDPVNDHDRFYYPDSKKWCAFYYNGKEITIVPTADADQMKDLILKPFQETAKYFELHYLESSKRIQSLIDRQSEEIERCKAIKKNHHMIPYLEGQRVRLYGMKMIEEAGHEVRMRIAEEEYQEALAIVTIASKIGNEIRARNAVPNENSSGDASETCNEIRARNALLNENSLGDGPMVPAEDAPAAASSESDRAKLMHMLAQLQTELKETRAKKASSVKFPFKAFRVLITLLIMYAVHQVLSVK
jgi:hypothetical protein